MRLDPIRFEIIDEEMARILRLKTPQQRLEMAESMSRMVRDQIRAKLKQDHPEWSDEAVSRETAKRFSRGTV
jgi:hypothetical protein